MPSTLKTRSCAAAAWTGPQPATPGERPSHANPGGPDRHPRRGTATHDRLLHRERGAAHDRRRSEGQPAAARAGRVRLRHRLRAATGPRRPAGRQYRPQAAVPAGHGRVHSHLAGVRAGSDRYVPGNRPGRAGRVGGHDGPAGSRDYPSGDNWGAPHEGTRPVRRDRRPGCCARPGPRRAAHLGEHRRPRLAADLPGQRPHRAGGPAASQAVRAGHPARCARADRRARHGAARPDRAGPAHPADRRTLAAAGRPGPSRYWSSHRSRPLPSRGSSAGPSELAARRSCRRPCCRIRACDAV